ncbi:MAG: hypothetical protein LBT19_01450 [Candidatus Nomurabacteria bacterium]|jgi:phosphoglucosamine mutase|nr:hypothetical protein [Candidatus Nomurabacteria bacterium]
MEKRIFEKTDGIRAKVGEEPLVPKTVQRLGGAISKFFNNGKIIIGRDTRESGEWISQELEKGMSEAGATILEAGTVPTPVVALLVKTDESANGGIMITASHNPATDNGIKVFHSGGDKLMDSEELEIENIFFSDWPPADAAISEPVAPLEDVTFRYSSELRKFLGNEDLSEYQAYVDSAAGSTYDFINKVSSSFGVQFDEIGPNPTGENINTNCGALYPEKLSEIMRQNPVDLGVAFDGDGDRIVLVDDLGRIWDGDHIVAMIATYLKSQENLPNNTVVLTEYSNLGAIQYLEQNGIRVEKVENGDKAVARKCQEVGAVLGGEFSGHIIFTTWLSSSDGIMIAFFTLLIVKRTGKKLSELWPAYENLPSKQWGINVREKLPLSEVPGWQAELDRQTDFLGTDGRIFVRYSGTEKKLRILVDATDATKMNQVGDILSSIIEKEIGQ